jgi:hypothetical protein
LGDRFHRELEAAQYKSAHSPSPLSPFHKLPQTSSDHYSKLPKVLLSTYHIYNMAQLASFKIPAIDNEPMVSVVETVYPSRRILDLSVGDRDAVLMVI